MATNVSAAKSPWNGAWVALAGIAVVSVVAVVRDQGIDSWLWMVAVCLMGGFFSAVFQAGRNRRLDRAVRQAREAAGRV